MKLLKLDKSEENPEVVSLPTSKSLSNRYLILKSFLPGLELINLSKAADSRLLKNALNSAESKIDCGHGGTTIRFLTAYFACQPGRNVELGGSDRLNSRPIGPLVNALKDLGADIKCLGEEGFPPIRIRGRKLSVKKVRIEGSISSQFISALMLIGPFLENGLEIILENDIVSKSYLDMTIDCILKVGAEVERSENSFRIMPIAKRDIQSKINIESDWSAAAFWYSRIALSKEGSKLELTGLESSSSQGDAKVIDFFETLGVRSRFTPQGIVIRKSGSPLPKLLAINLLSHPDLAQPIAVTCAALGVDLKLTGLQTLTIKESNRLKALKSELEKFEIDSEITDSSISIKAQKIKAPTKAISTFNDHRMAMSFAVLSGLFPLEILEPDVVEKSYPSFWEDLIKK